MARSGLARVAATLAFILALGLLSAVPDGAWAQAPSQATSQAPSDAPPAKASKKKSAAKTAEPGSGAGEAGDAAKKAARDPAAVQKALDAAQKSLDAGKADIAFSQANALISAGGLESRFMARALALRGHAYKKQGKPAQAIADLQSALWLKGGLTETERTSALQARAEAYREAGLGDAPPISGVSANTPAGNGQQSRPIATATVAPRPSPEPANGVSNFFSNLFGGGQKAAPDAASAPPQAAVNPAVSSWSEAATSVKPAPPKPAIKTASVAKPKTEGPVKVAAAAPAAVAPAASPVAAIPAAAPASVVVTTGQPAAAIRIQLVAVRTVEEAQAISQRISRDFGDRIGARDFEVEQVNFGGMGTFYRVRIGPFAEAAEAQGVCGSIRAKGTDCMLLTQ